MLAIDFDGVVCDALAECALVTWLGSDGRRSWTSGSTELRRMPRGFVQRFRHVRDYARVLDHFVLAHVPYAAWLSGQKDFDRVFGSLPDGYVRRFTSAAGAARTTIRRDEPEFWLGMHTLYPGVADLLRRHAGRTAIVTAKDEDSVRAILRRHDLEHTVLEVVGECARKAEAVRDLCTRHGVDPARATFVDDNLTNVRRVGAVGVRTLWATWGYQTPDDRAAADRYGVRRLGLSELSTVDARS